MSFAEKIAAAQEAAAKQPTKRASKGPTVRDHVAQALDDGLTDGAAVLRYVLAQQGFRSAGLDAMGDDELAKICATGRTVDMTLRRERRSRGQ